MNQRQCRHCPNLAYYLRRNLCNKCWNDPAVKALYPAKKLVAVERDPRPKRQQGEPYYTCLGCMRYRCDQPLKLCGECVAMHLEAVAKIPAPRKRKKKALQSAE